MGGIRKTDDIEVDVGTLGRHLKSLTVAGGGRLHHADRHPLRIIRGIAPVIAKAELHIGADAEIEIAMAPDDREYRIVEKILVLRNILIKKLIGVDAVGDVDLCAYDIFQFLVGTSVGMLLRGKWQRGSECHYRKQS